MPSWDFNQQAPQPWASPCFHETLGRRRTTRDSFDRLMPSNEHFVLFGIIACYLVDVVSKFML